MATNKKIKVLMLGWEFPPLLTGGLGQACYGLFKALNPKTELSLILPKYEAEPHAKKVISLDNISEKDLEVLKIEKIYKEFQEVVFVPTEVSPYPIPIIRTVKYMEELQKTEPYEVAIDDIKAVYASGELYGSDIMQKTALYAETVARLAQNVDFDVIHAHDWLTFAAALKIKQNTGKPFIAQIHSLETDRIGMNARSTHNAVYKLEYDGMLNADAVIAVSNFTKKCILEHYQGIEESKIFVIHNGLTTDEPDFQIQTKPTSFANGKKIILSVGRITHQKGPEFLLKTAERLLGMDNEVIFVLAGSGDKQAWLQQEVMKRNMGAHFIFTGFVSRTKVAELLSLADAFFMPSTSEPFGISALEAAYFGVPVVVSKQSGVSEVLHHALQADCWDIDKFANYLYAILHYPNISKGLIESAKREAEDLTWDSSAKKVLEVYQYALN